ncbi:Uma2 family endonuclease [Saccharothrix algeriensis]|uniref:Uma2 family endonuclease n=1 Tax=Saccharothrix algeriensis TaxID=173560 RepID=A0A8T8HU90_9PSEU|nr:Uma2 family endonuclease [Saccharothrix algeriensis]MBM7813643.1 Uma2 family endonuclease [Saccharothrix algeriensis]QTR02123.1 Uma2 family endonuclease [Saccharothrix algeriensis]
MSVVPWPDHLLTLDEWDALPDDESHHVELVEGVLLVAPRPASKHQMAIKRLGTWFDDQLPESVVAAPEVDVLINPVHPVTVRAPDVVVVPTERAMEFPTRYDADDVLLAVEIVSPGTGRTDRVTKLFEYADAGIPHYWLLDLDDPISLTAFTLVDGDYEHVAGGTGKVELPSPFPVAFDLQALLTR